MGICLVIVELRKLSIFSKKYIAIKSIQQDVQVKLFFQAIDIGTAARNAHMQEENEYLTVYRNFKLLMNTETRNKQRPEKP